MSGNIEFGPVTLKIPNWKNPGVWYFLKTSSKLVGKGQKNPVFTFQCNGFLISPNGAFWPARTGPHGKGALPDGHYRITKPTIRTKAAYRDKKGFCWFCHIPSKVINKVWNRYEFGIHPDGSVAGTMGCIGLTDSDTRSAYNALSKTSTKDLIVKPATLSDEDVLVPLYLKYSGINHWC